MARLDKLAGSPGRDRQVAQGCETPPDSEVARVALSRPSPTREAEDCGDGGATAVRRARWG